MHLSTLIQDASTCNRKQLAQTTTKTRHCRMLSQKWNMYTVHLIQRVKVHCGKVGRAGIGARDIVRPENRQLKLLPKLSMSQANQATMNHHKYFLCYSVFHSCNKYQKKAT